MVGFEEGLFTVAFVLSVVVSTRRPKVPFIIAFVGTITLYPWAVFDIANMQITYFDAIFAGFFLVELLSWSRIREFKSPKGLYFWSPILAITIFLSVYLVPPLIAFLLGNWSASVLTPGIRMLQWVLYGLFAGKLYIDNTISEGEILNIFCFTIIAHTIYASLQYLEFFGYVSLPHHEYFSDRKTWFFQGRSTGLLTNPNGYGILMAMLSISTATAIFQEQIQHRSRLLLIVGAGILGILMSGSRTAILMFGVGLVTCPIAISKVRKRHFFASLSIAIPPTIIIDSLTGGRLLARFDSIFSVLTGDIRQVSNLLTRFEYWQNSIQYVNINGPSFVNPTYVISHATDNFFVSIFVQSWYFGFFAYLFLLLSVSIFSYRATLLGNNGFIPKSTSILALMVLVGTNFIEIITNPTLSIVFWVMVGITIFSTAKHHDFVASY